MVEIAAQLRRCSGLAKPPYSTSKIIEACFPEILVTGYRLPPSVDEIVSSCSEGPTIMYSRSLSIPEQRYAIAHGLAHLIFDDRHACMRPGRAGLARVELRADFFGAELLVPTSDLVPLVERLASDDDEENEIYLDHLDRLASIFNMPVSVIEAQIQRLGLTDTKVSQIRLTKW